MELARLADLHLQLHPGTNVALLNGMGRVIAKNISPMRHSLRDRTEGSMTGWHVVEDRTPEVTSNADRRARSSHHRRRRDDTPESGGSMAVHGLGMTEHRWAATGDGAGESRAGDREHRKNPAPGSTVARANNVQGHRMSAVYRHSLPGISRSRDPALAAAHLAVTGRPLPTAKGMKPRHVGRGAGWFGSRRSDRRI